MWLFYLYALNITMFAWNLMLTQQTSIEFRLKIFGRVKDYKVHKIKTKKKKNSIEDEVDCSLVRKWQKIYVMGFNHFT